MKLRAVLVHLRAQARSKQTSLAIPRGPRRRCCCSFITLYLKCLIAPLENAREVNENTRGLYKRARAKHLQYARATLDAFMSNAERERERARVECILLVTVISHTPRLKGDLVHIRTRMAIHTYKFFEHLVGALGVDIIPV